ncbi:class E sortase [Curtobacterium flaccumfaciens]|uniref:class E sortase n=1 Tax=Curtobacterium TaxID=2034 RepID=UPI002175E8AD|nr:MULTISPECIES: class E sortase [Curtobacterium]MCS5494576.1 class E sortase [Curtobacterium flaccumfaciens pv. flaccumfaciens]MCS5504617.1 class E sortase [Curtobacterium flaccumfaciens pv. flaccumfaciens]UWD83279.1 class E sortase [Curtobacterium flaccumfaciens]
MTAHDTIPSRRSARDDEAGSRSRRSPRRRQTVGGAIVSLIAELLIIAGAGTGLYVVWTAWWTDVVAVNEQTKLVQGLDQVETPKVEGTEHRGTAPVLDEPPALSDVFGTMQIPRFGNDYNRPIGEGTDREKVLNTIGLGHYQGTAMPGAPGNFAVAGHRVTYGKPLNQIAELQKGDSVVVRVTDAKTKFDVWYVYKVTDSQIVTPDKIETIAPVPNKPGVEPTTQDRWLTLTACHPMWSAAERYVTHAKLDYWMPASEGTPKELSETAK